MMQSTREIVAKAKQTCSIEADIGTDLQITDVRIRCKSL